MAGEIFFGNKGTNFDAELGGRTFRKRFALLYFRETGASPNAAYSPFLPEGWGNFFYEVSVLATEAFIANRLTLRATS